MKALVLEAYKEFALRDVPTPKPGTGDVVIEVKACGICGSDVHGMDGSSGRRQPPVIMGHEAAGVIAEVGSAVTGWAVGEAVTFDSTIYCGTCRHCRRGEINLCDNRRVLGVSCDDYRQDGAFAEYVKVPEHILYRLPDGMAPTHGAMVEPVSIALHAVRRTPVDLGDSAVVVGAGMIGLLVVQALLAAGCETVIAIDLDDGRLSLASTLGATHTINAREGDVAARVKELTEGRGADIAVEAVGASATVLQAVEVVRKGGHVTLVGNLSARTDFPLQSVVTREISVFGSCASRGEYPACLKLINNKAIDLSPLVSAVAPLSEGASWFERLYKREAGLMKVILEPGS